MRAVRFEVEHCAGSDFSKVRDDLGHRSIRRDVFRCSGCGAEFFLTVTMRPVPTDPASLQQILPVPLPPHRAPVLRS